MTTLFLTERLTTRNALPGHSSRLAVERRFVPLSSHEALERSERFRSLLLRGAVIFATANEEDTRGTN
jgi:hypothetical protein